MARFAEQMVTRYAPTTPLGQQQQHHGTSKCDSTLRFDSYRNPTPSVSEGFECSSVVGEFRFPGWTSAIRIHLPTVNITQLPGPRG